MRYPSQYATAAEWLAAGWEWRNSAWWRWDEESATWHRVTGAQARPYQETMRQEGSNQFQDSFRGYIPD